MTILDQLAAHARQRVAADQEKHSLHELKARCKEAGRAGGERFFQALCWHPVSRHRDSPKARGRRVHRFCIRSSFLWKDGWIW